MHYFFSIKRWQQEIIPNFTLPENNEDEGDEILKGLITPMISNDVISKIFQELLNDIEENSLFSEDVKWPNE